MIRTLTTITLLATALVGLAWEGAAAQSNPCATITAACRSAGFVPGGAQAGNGLVVDCIRPIIDGTEPPAKTAPLPQVAPSVVSACRAGNPTFGQVGPARQQPATVVASVNIADQLQPSTLPLAARPNIIFVLADDFSWNLVQFMPRLQAMQKSGVTFAHYFVTDSLCCPSRSSIFTGKYPHDTGVYKNTGEDGGFLAFNSHGNVTQTFAVALQHAGYKTAMLGKYLNGYRPQTDAPPPGWDEWHVAGNGYPEFNYALNENGTVKRYGSDPNFYLTDVLSDIAEGIIRGSGAAPFFIEIATFSPHAPYVPAPRDAAAFPGLQTPRTPAFNAVPDASTVKWLAAHQELSPDEIDRIDADFRKRAQSVLAIDTMIGKLQVALAAMGKDKKTVLVFSSDNGYHMGEHRLMPGKMTAFDTDIRVPLIVMGPAIGGGTSIDAVAQNIDLAPTFIELAGMAAPASVDGRSLVPLLYGRTVPDWRKVALVEHRGPHDDATDPDAPAARSGNPTTYEAMRSATTVYVEYADGEREHHDLVKDPNELVNSYATLSDAMKAALHADLQAVQNCHDGRNCHMAERAEQTAIAK